MDPIVRIQHVFVPPAGNEASWQGQRPDVDLQAPVALAVAWPTSLNT